MHAVGLVIDADCWMLIGVMTYERMAHCSDYSPTQETFGAAFFLQVITLT